ncbi:MAG: peptidase C56 [Pseudonocardia sp. SCN 72-86]|nr:MAG: peptidase C56 [Pseudonocardia sp. SCN 72-86]
MSGTLEGLRIAVLATDGVEEVELVEPRAAVEREGATTELVSLARGEVQAMNGDIEPAGTHPVDKLVADVAATDYDAVIMPGGTVNADRLRMDADVLRFVKDAFTAELPVAAICHAPWTLVEAEVLDGRKLTSFPSLRTDLRNAGAFPVDEQVVVDGPLVTSRNPDDLPAFCERIVQEFAAVRT